MRRGEDRTGVKSVAFDDPESNTQVVSPARPVVSVTGGVPLFYPQVIGKRSVTLGPRLDQLSPSQWPEGYVVYSCTDATELHSIRRTNVYVACESLNINV